MLFQCTEIVSNAKASICQLTALTVLAQVPQFVELVFKLTHIPEQQLGAVTEH